MSTSASLHLIGSHIGGAGFYCGAHACSKGWRNRNLSGRWERGWGPRGWRAKVKAGGPGLTRLCLQRARTDEATATGSRSEAEDEDDEDYVPYVPLRQRRQMLVRAVGREKSEGRR